MNPRPGAPPTEQQAFQILQTLVERDAAAEDERSAFEAETAERRGKIFLLRAFLATSRRIPLEILTYIFGFLIYSTPDAVFHASHVCRKWRNAAVISSRLWSNIIIASQTEGARWKAQLYLKRSRQAPLSVTFVQSRQVHQWPAWGAIKCSVERWSSLSLTMHDSRALSRELCALPAAPGLADLSVTILSSCGDAIRDGHCGFEHDHTGNHSTSLAGSPFIRTLHLSIFTLPFPGSLFLRLTKLSITDTFSTLDNLGTQRTPINGTDLMGLLKFCPNLEEFTFDAEGSITWWAFNSGDIGLAASEYISHPQLRSLHLHCHYSCAVNVLSYLTAENLESATLRMRPRYESSESKLLESVALAFLRRAQNLRALRIHAFPGLAMTAAMVASLSHLESLHLDHSPTPDVVIRALQINEKFGYFAQPTWLAPKLSNLVIDAQPMDLDYENLSILHKSRYYHNIKQGMPSPLKSFIVNGRDMLKGAPPGDIVESDRITHFDGQTWEMHQGRAIYPDAV